LRALWRGLPVCGRKTNPKNTVQAYLILGLHGMAGIYMD
jgi:hypothetical protein